MSDYNWCHGPSCHTHKTQDRIRGVKGSKVLRTKKVPYYGRDVHDWINYFCSQNCLMDFIKKHCNEMIALEPRTECLETPIEVEVETRTDYFGNPYKQKAIRAIDNG
tara:strand:- start:345 stop:665 length:321 start_codon:yes stop_codon:yes gene_type:complete